MANKPGCNHERQKGSNKQHQEQFNNHRGSPPLEFNFAHEIDDPASKCVCLIFVVIIVGHTTSYPSIAAEAISCTIIIKVRIILDWDGAAWTLVHLVFAVT